MTALVTSANSPKALSVIRSLGKKGVEVTAGSDIQSPLGSSSKYCSHAFQYASPVKSPEQYCSSLAGFLKHHPHDVLIPVHSDDTYLVARYRDFLGKYTKIPLHDYGTIMEANDKGRLMQVANDLGIPCPATYFINEPSDIVKISASVEYPVVIKLRSSSGSRGIEYASSPEELIKKCSSMIERYQLTRETYPLVQEYILGDGYGVSLLFNNREVRAKCTHRRLREFPITGGPSTLRVSVNSPAMEKIAINLLEHYHWHGVAMVEFKLRDSDKKPFLIEVNPRIWGSINQSILAGVDFPYLLYTMAMEGDVKPVMQHNVGIYSRNILSDIVAMGSYLWHSGKVKNLGKSTIFPLNDDIISWEDPRPLFRFAGTGLRYLLNHNSIG
jgi:predicted ATP-grasp superfamily ATP-dependent carboligase